MIKDKWDVVKQETARVNDILGISELKWTAMGEFISTTVGKDPLEEM